MVEHPFLPDPGILAEIFRVSVSFIGAGRERTFSVDQGAYFGDRGRYPTDPKHMLSHGLQVMCGTKRRIGHMVDHFIESQIFLEILDDRQDRFFVRIISGEGLKKERHTLVVRGHPEDESLEIPPAILRMAVGDLDLPDIEI